jgi:uncharacterized protein (TIGR00251 family)
VQDARETTTIEVKAVPRASRDEIAGWLGAAVKVRVTAPPEAGRANTAIEDVLAAALGVRRATVTVVAGHTAARKRVAIEGLGRAEVDRRLGRP